MKKIILSLSLLALIFGKSHAQEDKAAWFKEARFGMFVHWGLYSILGGSYQGRTLPDKSLPNGNSWYAEWVQARLEVPESEYRKLAGRFNPESFDADAWIREARNAGMKYFVITAKHHDGFALWDSEVSTYDIGATPFKNRDILGELVAACRKYGLKYGFYYSHWHDWEQKGGAKPHWIREQPTQEEFEQYWQSKSLPQVRELITRYDPDMLWFDTWDNEAAPLITPERRDELIKTVRNLSSKCLINGRIAMHNPGDEIDFLEMMDNVYPKTLQAKPWQTPATMQRSWGYHAGDYNWKPANQMLRYLVSNASKGGNYLLNIGPDAQGSLPLPAIQRLREMGAWLLTNGESVFQTQPVTGITAITPNVFLTWRPVKTLYAGVAENPENNRVIIDTKGRKVTGCHLLETGMPLSYTFNSSGQLEITLPDAPRYDSSIREIKIELADE